MEGYVLYSDRERTEILYNHLNCKYVQESMPKLLVAQALKGYGEPELGKKALRLVLFDFGSSGYTNFIDDISI